MNTMHICPNCGGARFLGSGPVSYVGKACLCYNSTTNHQYNIQNESVYQNNQPYITTELHNVLQKKIEVQQKTSPEGNSATGIKHDQEKPDMSLLSSVALNKIAQVMTFGKKKYSAHNWRGGIAWSRVLAAAMRHLLAYLGGEDKDPETGLSHLAHLGCCVMFLLEFEDTHKEMDDRYKNEK